jgi:hypothetical protein
MFVLFERAITLVAAFGHVNGFRVEIQKRGGDIIDVALMETGCLGDEARRRGLHWKASFAVTLRETGMAVWDRSRFHWPARCRPELTPALPANLRRGVVAVSLMK